MEARNLQQVGAAALMHFLEHLQNPLTELELCHHVPTRSFVSDRSSLFPFPRSTLQAGVCGMRKRDSPQK